MGDPQPVNPDRFPVVKMGVDDDGETMASYCKKKGLLWTKNRGFYLLSKRESVTQKKDIVIKHKRSGTMFYGEEARKILGVPTNEDVFLHPAEFKAFEIFVQSTSTGRRLRFRWKFMREDLGVPLRLSGEETQTALERFNDPKGKAPAKRKRAGSETSGNKKAKSKGKEPIEFGEETWFDNIGEAGEEQEQMLIDGMEPAVHFVFGLEELILKIFDELPRATLARAAQVCRRWRRVASSPEYWKSITIEGKKVSSRNIFSNIGVLQPKEVIVKDNAKNPESYFSGLKFKDAHAKSIAKWGGCLERLTIECSQLLSDVGMRALGSACSSLKRLTLNHCPAVGFNGMSWVGVTCTELTHMHLENCDDMTSPCLIMLCEKLKSLKHLSLVRMAGVTGNTLLHIGKHLPELRSFCLNGCGGYQWRELSTGFVSALDMCTQLNDVFVQNLQVDEVLESWAPSLVKLPLKRIYSVRAYFGQINQNNMDLIEILFDSPALDTLEEFHLDISDLGGNNIDNLYALIPQLRRLREQCKHPLKLVFPETLQALTVTDGPFTAFFDQLREAKWELIFGNYGYHWDSHDPN